MKMPLLFLFLALPIFAADDLVIHRGDKPPVGVPYSYFEDYSAEDQAKIKARQEGKVIVETPKKSEEKPIERISINNFKKENGSPQYGVMDGKTYRVIRRGDAPPKSGEVYMYFEDIDCKKGH